MPKKKKISWRWLYIFAAILICSGVWFVYKFYTDLNKIQYYNVKKVSTTESLKYSHVFRKNPDALLGLDLSHYQDQINWNTLKS